MILIDTDVLANIDEYDTDKSKPVKLPGGMSLVVAGISIIPMTAICIIREDLSGKLYVVMWGESTASASMVNGAEVSEDMIQVFRDSGMVTLDRL